MLTRADARRALIDHMQHDAFDYKALTDRDILELLLHILIERERDHGINIIAKLLTGPTD
jgi:hypothetical protein